MTTVTPAGTQCTLHMSEPNYYLRTTLGLILKRFLKCPKIKRLYSDRVASVLIKDLHTDPRCQVNNTTHKTATMTDSCCCSEQPAAPALFTFGVIADVQYADVEDGFNYTRTRRRYYRSSLRLLRNARESWSGAAVRPSFILQLGDIIDGLNKERGASVRALDTVMRELTGTGTAPVHHVWGNHEFYNFSRETLMRSELNSAPHSCGGGGEAAAAPPAVDIYAYHFNPAPKFRFIVLDAYDVSLLGRTVSSVQYNNALNILKEHNSNEDLNHPPAEEGMKRKFVKFNGGFSRDQLNWLDGVLSMSDENQEKVIIVSHLPVHPLSTEPICLAWNSEDLLAVIGAHGCVVCFMAGHDHDGGYHRDRGSGVHHLTLEGVIETPPESDAFATVSVYEDRMSLKGRGRTADRELVFAWPPYETLIM